MRSKNFSFYFPFHSRKPLAGMSALALLALAACSPEGGQSSDKQAAAGAQACGNVSIASMNWQSAEVLAQIDKLILEKGFGCQVEIVPGDTVPTATAMTEKGNPDIAPELWLSSVKEPIDKAVKEGRLYYAATSLQDGGVEGWWIPKYVADAHPEIKTIADALAHKELFPAPDDKSKGVVYGCPSGWACQISTKQIFKAAGAEQKGFVLKDPGSAAGLDGSIAKAYQRKEAWLGYYWSPTSILGKYEMVRLDTGVPFDQAEWERCTSKDKCPDPKMNDWAKSEVKTVVTSRFKNQGGQAFDYVSKRSWKNDTVNQLLAWMSDNQATGEDGAKHFLKTQPEVWRSWVTPEVAEKIKGEL